MLVAKDLLLRTSTVLGATLIGSPIFTENFSGERDPEVDQSRKRKQWHHRMKSRIGVDSDFGLVHSVRDMAGNVNDLVESNLPLRGQHTVAFGDAGYQRTDKRPDARTSERSNFSMSLGKCALLDKTHRVDQFGDQNEYFKASIRAEVERPFRVTRLRFGQLKDCYRALKKSTAQLDILFALSKFCVLRRQLVEVGA